MSNFKKSFATMFAAIMMLTGIIILGTSTVAKAVTYPLTQNIDFGADGELTVNLKPTSPTTVKGNANILQVSRLTQLAFISQSTVFTWRLR